MSADLLHRAARTLRDLARATTPGDWEFYGGKEFGIEAVHNGHDVAMFPTTCQDPDHINRQRQDAEYVALMHPPVAIELAELLESIAVRWVGAPAVQQYPARAAFQATALDVARAVLREPEDTAP